MECNVIKTGGAICKVSDLCERQSVKFLLETPKGPREAFLFRYQEGFYAYLNLCQHMAMALDYDSNEFFAQDGCSIICYAHGALYRPQTGYCFAGPPNGDALTTVKIAIKDNWIYLEQRPEDFQSDDL
jgi:nitrite reductase/ring-hydroxylating ferredoxin subunit